MRFLSEQELRLMVETRPTETITYIKKLEQQIKNLTKPTESHLQEEIK